MIFIRPEYLWLLLPMCLWFLWRWRYQWQTGSFGRIIDSHLLPYLDISKSNGSSKWTEAMWFIFFLMAIIALSGPSFSKKQVPVFRSNETVIWVQDLSNQVLVEDIKPDRLARAKYVLLDVLNDYPYQVGLVAFAQDQHVIMPVTYDKAIIKESVSWLSPDIMPLGGYQPSTGVKRAIELAKAGHAQKAVIILATSGPVDSALLGAAIEVRQAGFHLSVLGLGTKEGGPIPTVNGYEKHQDGSLKMSSIDEQLAEVAKQGNGIYGTVLTSNSILNDMLSPLRNISSTSHQLKQSIFINDDHGYRLLWLILPLLIIGLLKHRLEVLIR